VGQRFVFHARAAGTPDRHGVCGPVAATLKDLNEIGFFETLSTPHGPARFPGSGSVPTPKPLTARRKTKSPAARGIAARQHISVAAAPCLPLMRSART
jgi:hypothetical protein